MTTSFYKEYKGNSKAFSSMISKLLYGFVMSMFFITQPIEANMGKIPLLEGSFTHYTAKEGEDLYPISRKFNLAIEHVMFANGMSDINTYPGQKLLIPTRRIPPSDALNNGVVLNLPERGLYLFENGKVKKFYPVTIGSTGKWMTPTGVFKIINKVKDPTWIPPEWAEEEEPVPAGPDNPLGDRWMGLDKPGYGIHATNRPVSIGLAASHGCIRMYPEHAHELFEQVSVGTTVKIIYEPIKIGYDSKEKRFYMEVYPDVYSKTSGLDKHAREKLRELGLLEIVDDKTLERILSKPSGIPEAILGSDIVVKVNDKVQNLSFPPIIKDGRVWTTSEILRLVGATLIWNNANKTMEVHRGRRKVTLSVVTTGGTNNNPVKKGEVVSYLWNGRTIIPAGYVLRELGVNFQWLPQNRTLLVYSGASRPAQAAPAQPPKAEASVKPVVKTSPPSASAPKLTPLPSPAAATKPTPAVTPASVPSPTPSPSPSPEVEAPKAPVPSVVPDDIPLEEEEEPDSKETPSSPAPAPSPTPKPTPSPEPAPSNTPDDYDQSHSY